MISKINLRDAFGTFTDHWSPRLAAHVSGHEVKLARIKGEFVWHHHDDADEMFLVVKGQMEMQLADQESITLEEGEMIVVPRGVEHRPVASDEAWILLVEPSGVVNTGSAGGERTAPVTDLPR